jgi:hypothetical protein
MSDKQISGKLASDMIIAAQHLAKLQVEFDALKWRICYREDLHIWFSEVRMQCRRLSEALNSADFHHRVAEEDRKAAAEQQPAIRQVK